MKRIHCLGTVVLDALSGPLNHYPAPRIEPQVTTDTIRFVPGGGAGNSAAALSRMGFSATVFSKVGDDLAGSFITAELERYGVNISGIRISKGETTPFTFVGVHPEGERTFVHTPGTNKTFTPNDLDLEQLLAADFLLFPDYWGIPGLEREAGAAILVEAQQRGVTTLLDECWGFGPNRESWEMMLPYCDYALPSFADMQAIYPGASAEKIADHLLACGVHNVVLKLGEEGCLVAQGTGQVHVPTVPTEIVDATGAGDCWNAGFVAALAERQDIIAAARIGCASAAFCLSAVGGATGIPKYDAVVSRAEEGSQHKGTKNTKSH